MRWRIPLLLTLVALVAVSCDQQPLAPSADDSIAEVPSMKVVRNDKVYYQEYDETNACTGELHHISGYLHIVEKVTEDAAGGIHYMGHYHPLGWIAVGNDSGIVCRMTGKTGFTDNYGPGDLPYSGTFVYRYHMVCPGPGNDLVVFETWHMTVTPDGVITAEVDKTRTECDSS